VGGAVPEDVDAFFRVGADEMDVGILFETEIEPDDLAVDTRKDRVPRRLHLREEIPDPGSFLNRENDPIDVDIHLIDP